MYLSWALLLLVLPALAQCHKFYRNDLQPMDYRNHKLVKISPSSLEQAARLRVLEQEFELDYWNPVDAVLRPVLTLVDPQRSHFLHQLNRSSIAYSIVSHSIQNEINRERSQMLRTRLRNFGQFDFEGQYHTYDEIKQQLKLMANQNSSIKAEYFSVGDSYEGREIPGIRFGNGPAVFLECGIHSREWVSVALCLWTVNQLLNKPELKSYSDKFEFVVVPVLNVDGYQFTHTTDRLWRKTRSPTTESDCIGADPNRNFDSKFGQEGASSDPCSEIYAGRSAFSESETKAMSELAAKYRGNMAVYFGIHSFSQLWMHPWGHTQSLPPNHQQLKELADVAANAVQKVNGLEFQTGSISNVIYMASGSSVDWIYDSLGTKLAYAVEMRDRGQCGFLLPPEQIKPACEETWAGIRAIIDKL